MLHHKLGRRRSLPSLVQLTEHWSDWLDLWSISIGQSQTIAPIWSSFRLGRSHQITHKAKPISLSAGSLISIQLITILGHELRLELRIPSLKPGESKQMVWMDPERTVPIPR